MSSIFGKKKTNKKKEAPNIENINDKISKLNSTTSDLKEEKEAPNEIKNIDDKISKLNDTISALEKESQKCTQLKRELKKSYEEFMKETDKRMKDSKHSSPGKDNSLALSTLYKVFAPLDNKKIKCDMYEYGEFVKQKGGQ